MSQTEPEHHDSPVPPDVIVCSFVKPMSGSSSSESLVPGAALHVLRVGQFPFAGPTSF